MLISLTLRNYKSFGEEQRVPLSPITLLVGPNNSGKSCLMSVGRFVSRLLGSPPSDGLKSALAREGGHDAVFHRPLVLDDDGQERLSLGWELDRVGSYTTEWTCHRDLSEIRQTAETFSGTDAANVLSAYVQRPAEENAHYRLQDWVPSTHTPCAGLRVGWSVGNELVRAVASPFARSRLVRLTPGALRMALSERAEPKLEDDGTGLALVVKEWRSAHPPRAQQLDDFMKKCIPEIGFIGVRSVAQASPYANRGAEPETVQRLFIEQTDGERFDADLLSDGVLAFIALAVIAIEAEPGAVIFLEEPEHSIHPRRIGELVDLLRAVSQARQSQFVLATHSPVLIDAMRDEPEAILLFRRSDQGTQVRPLSDVPELVEAMSDVPPGLMLADGFFDRAF